MSNLPPPGGPPPQNYPATPPPLNYSMPLNYAAPPAARNDLREIAIRQKGIMYCILAYIVCAVAAGGFPNELKIIPALCVLAAAITGAVFVFMLALAVYNTGSGILLGILTLVPIVGLIVLLIVNGKATSILRAHGIRVGLMGAALKQIPQAGIIN